MNHSYELAVQFVALKDQAEVTLSGALSETVTLLDAFSLLVLPPTPFLGFFQEHFLNKLLAHISSSQGLLLKNLT